MTVEIWKLVESFDLDVSVFRQTSLGASNNVDKTVSQKKTFSVSFKLPSLFSMEIASNHYHISVCESVTCDSVLQYFFH